MSINSWDQKWLYLVAKFVSPSDKPNKNSTRHKLTSSRSAQNLKMLAKDVVTPAHEAEKKAKEKEEKKKRGEILPEEKEALKKAAEVEEEAVEDEESNGNVVDSLKDRTLYCTSISRYCFKSGRKTIPPWLVIATSGYGQWASTRSNWDRAEDLRTSLLSKARADHQHRFGRPLPRDGLIAGQGFRKTGEFVSDWIYFSSNDAIITLNLSSSFAVFKRCRNLE